MTRLLALLQWLYRTRSGYPDDPKGWLGHQAAHALYVGGAVVALTGNLILLGALDGAWELGRAVVAGRWAGCATGCSCSRAGC